ncbi:MAG: tetratricopeptide repeat protein [Planctomycetota bacterium]
MTGRVNVKFVIILSAALLTLFAAIAGAVFYVVVKSAEDYAGLARQYEAEDEWRRAASAWGSAVYRDQDNLDYLESWLEAYQRVEPENELEYEQLFLEKYYAALRTIASVKQTDAEAHARYLDVYRNRLQGFVNQQQEELFVTEVTNVLGQFSLAGQEGSPDSEFLRWYRGASLTKLIDSGITLPESREALAREDLEVALAARPDRFDVAEQLFLYHSALRDRADLARQSEQARAHADDATAVLEGFIRANPSDAAALTLDLVDRAERTLRAVDLDIPAAELIAQRTDALDVIRPDFDDLVARLGGELAQQVDGDTAQRIMLLAQRFAPSSWPEVAAPIWDLAAQNNPETSLTLLNRAGFLALARRRDDAMEAFEQVASLPDPPINYEGVLRFRTRPFAEYRRATLAIERWEASSLEGPEKDALLNEAKRLRDDLASKRLESDSQLLLVNAKLAVAEKRFAEADRILKRYNGAAQQPNAEALRLSGLVLSELGNTGAARDAFEQAYELEPFNFVTLIQLSRIERELKDYTSAAEWLRRASSLNPDSEPLKQEIRQLGVLTGENAPADACEGYRIQAQIANDAGDTPSYIEALRRSVEECGNPAFSRLLAQALRQQNDVEGAIAVVEQGLRLFPDDAGLRRLMSLLTSDDPTQELIEAITTNPDLSDAARAKQIYRVLAVSGETDRADEVLEEAIRLNPNDSELLATKFDRALAAGDTATAESLIEPLSRADADGAEGRTFRAGLAFNSGDFEEAERLLRAAEEQGSTSARTVRLLAQVLARRGRAQDAIDAFARAYRIRPDDMSVILPYLDALYGSGRLNEALEVARASRPVGQNDPRFVRRWLTLEGEVGDRAMALDERLERSQSDPSDTENRTQIVALLMQLGRYDEARSRLDELRATEDSLDLVTLDARWYAQRNQLDEARDVFAAFLVDRGTEIEGPDAYIRFGSFLIEFGDTNAGLSTLRQARRFQDPDNPQADLVLAARYFDLGRFEEAAEIYSSLADTASDAGSLNKDSLLLRLAEAYVRLNRYDDAQQTLARVPQESSQTVSARLLTADIAAGRGRTADAIEQLDATVAEYPDEPLALLKRAELRVNQGELDDALADLDAALDIAPASSVALRLRATIRFESGDTIGAFEDMRAAVDSVPDDSRLRLAAAQRFVAADRIEDATELIDEGLIRQPNDIRLKANAGDLFARNNEFRIAARYHESAWEQAKSIALADRYVRSLILQQPPKTSEAFAVLRDPALDENDRPAARATLRARVEVAAENTGRARQQLDIAYDDIRDNTAALSTWVRALPEILGSQDEAVAYLETLAERGRLNAWARVFRAEVLLADGQTRSEGIASLESLIDGEVDTARRRRILGTLSAALFRAGRIEDAVDRINETLEIDPDNADLLNNKAYLLATELDQPQQAVDPASRAAELAPERWDIVDTLGVVQLLSGEPRIAIETLELALTLAPTPADKASVKINLAKATYATGDRTRASDLLNEVRTLVRQDADAAERLSERFEDAEASLR